jgi:hypothetical protein
MYKCLILPRQARDKHRKNSKRAAVLLQDRAEPPVGAKVALQLVQKFGADRMRWWVRRTPASALVCGFHTVVPSVSWQIAAFPYGCPERVSANRRFSVGKLLSSTALLRFFLAGCSIAYLTISWTSTTGEKVVLSTFLLFVVPSLSWQNRLLFCITA